MYNIYYDVAALILAIVINVIHIYFYSKEGNNRIFQVFVRLVALNCLLDIVSAWGIEQFFSVSDKVNTYLNSLYLISLLFVNFFAFRVIVARIGARRKNIVRVNQFVLLLGIAIIVINIPMGFSFRFDNHQYIKNGFWGGNIAYLICIWFLLNMLFVILTTPNGIKLSKRVTSAIGIVALSIPYILEGVFASILVIPLGMAFLALVICYTLETPDYEKLKLVLEELEQTKNREIESRELAEQSNREKTYFLENMSHELRTPINAIMGFNKMIQLGDIDEDIRQKSHSISEDSRKLLKLVGDILDFSQIETGKVEIKPEEYETISLYCYNIHTNDNYLDYSIPKRLYGDDNRIRQVLDNIYDYGVSLAPDAKVFFELSNLGIGDHQVRLKFAYRFIGLKIPDKDLALIESGSFDERIIYIAIAKKILNNMDGNLKITAGNADETLFSFEISQRIVDAKEMGKLSEAWTEYENNLGHEAEGLEFVAPTARVLAVDDVKLNLMVLGGLLNKFKVNLHTVNSGAAAVEYMEQNEVDIVFMDIMMPEMDGVETLHTIKTNPHIVSPDAIFIALTANVTVGAKEQYLEEGFDGYMSKPVELKKIGQTFLRFISDKIEDDWDEIIGIDENGKVI